MPNVSFINLVKANIHNKKSQQLHITSAAFPWPQSECPWCPCFLCGAVEQLLCLQFIVSVSLWGQHCSQDSLNIVCIGTAAFTTARDWLLRRQIISFWQSGRATIISNEVLILFKTGQYLFSCQSVSISDKLYTPP